MKKTFVLTLTALLFLVCKAEAAPNGFKDLVSSGTDGKYNLELAFERAPKAIINYYEKSIQIDVVDGIVSPSRRTFDVNRPDIKTINVYQFKPRLMRVRITPGEDGMRALKESFSFGSDGPKLLLKIGKKDKPVARASEILTQKAAKASKTTPKAEEPSFDDELTIDKPSAAAATAPSVEASASPAEAAKDGGDYLANIRKNLDEIKNEGTEADKSSADDPKPKLASYQPQSAQQSAPPQAPGLGEAFLKIGSALMVVLALIFLVSFGARKYLGTMDTALGSKKQLKVLSNHFIGVKKNVTIVEIGGEILVLGVTNTNVNLLAHFDEPEKIEAIKLAHRLPDKPLGIFKKFPMFGLFDKKAPQPANSRFARTAASYAENAAPAVREKTGGSEQLDVQATLSAARALKAKLRALEGTV